MATTQESLAPKAIKNPGQVDPDVVVPAPIKAAAARAEAIHKAAYPDPVVADGVNGATGTPGDPGTPEGAEAPKAPQLNQVTPQVSQVTPQVSQVAPQVGDDPANWEHKYTSMKGRYDKSQESIRQMADQITNLQNVLATVTSAPPGGSQAPPELQAGSLLSPEEVNEYGAEFLDVVGKKAREVAFSQVQGLQQEVQDLKRQLGYVGGSIAQSARERMFADLDQHMPAWREINQDQKFISWLALPDAYSGAIRHNLLKAAWERNDTPRSLAFFQGFLAEEAAVDPASVGTRPNGSRSPQQSGQQAERVTLESFAAPGRAKSAADVPAEKPIIRRSEISRFYADTAAGRYRGNEAEQKRLEAMIFSAQAENRIVNS